MTGEIEVRVRYADTDRMGVVHHARYLELLETGRVELMRRTDLSYRELEERGIFMPVIEVWLRYRRSATFDDVLRVRSWYRSLTRTRVTFGYRLLASTDEVVLEAMTMHAQTDRDGRPQPIDPDIVSRVRPHLVRDPVGSTRLSWEDPDR